MITPAKVPAGSEDEYFRSNPLFRGFLNKEVRDCLRPRSFGEQASYPRQVGERHSRVLLAK